MKTTEKKYEIIGWTDDAHDCDFCGKSELKSVAVMRDIETDEILYFGCDCARKATGIPTSEVKKQANSKNIQNRIAANCEYHSSEEYKEYEKAVKYCDNNGIHNPKSRMEYLKSYIENKEIKREELKKKYFQKHLN